MSTSPTLHEDLQRAQRTLKDAYLMFDAGCALEAVEACRRAAAEAPGHFLPPTLEGALLLALGRVRAALGVLRKAVRRFPDQPLPRFHFAEACLLAGRVERGLEALDAAERLAPEGPLLLSIQGLRALHEELAREDAPAPLEVPT